MGLIKYGFSLIMLFVGSALAAGAAWFIFDHAGCVSSSLCFRPFIETLPYAIWQFFIGVIDLIAVGAFLSGAKSSTWAALGFAFSVFGALMLIVRLTSGFGLGLSQGDAMLFLSTGVGLLGCGILLIGRHYTRGN